MASSARRAELMFLFITRPSRVKASRPCKKATQLSLRSFRGKRDLRPTRSQKSGNQQHAFEQFLAHPQRLGLFISPVSWLSAVSFQLSSGLFVIRRGKGNRLSF